MTSMARPGSTARIDIHQVREGGAALLHDLVATEEPMELRLVYWDGDREATMSLAITMRTPGHDFELAAGFLLTEGIAASRQDIERIVYCADVGPEQHYNVVSIYLRPTATFDPQRLQRHFYTNSSCGVCGKASLEALQLQRCPVLPSDRPRVTAEVILGFPDTLTKAQAIFQRTGGLHAAALFNSKGDLLLLREDVGRHNAVDKVVGERLLTGALPLYDCLLVVSGRASFEIVQKALAAGIPLVAAVGAPSSLAVDVAREFGITLLGFLRDGGFNVYAGGQRVLGIDTSRRPN